MAHVPERDMHVAAGGVHLAQSTLTLTTLVNLFFEYHA
jgi:hypothetical protein